MKFRSAALGPRAEAGDHLPQHSRHDRRGLSRRGEGDPRQSRRRAVRVKRGERSPSWCRRRCSRRELRRGRGARRDEPRRRGLRLDRPVSLSDAELERYARQIVLARGRRRRPEKAQSGAVSRLLARAGSAARSSRRSPGPASAGRRLSTATWASSPISIASRYLRTPMRVSRRRLGRPFVAARSILSVERLRRPSASALTMRADALANHDLVVDGSDNFATRLAVSDAWWRLAFPLFRRPQSSSRGRSGCSAASLVIAALSAMRSTPTIATIARSWACSAH